MPTEKPDFVEEKHLVYLDELRDSGQTSMFGAASYIEMEFPELLKRECTKILTYWMDTFSERH